MADPGQVLNYVALVVSLVALVGTAAQVAQQYYASAAGYSNCGESVMGEWHKSKKRIFRPTELRFEVRFETPVIFVCPAKNENGPVKGAKISYIEGTPESLAETRTVLPNNEKKPNGTKKQTKETKETNRVHTADNDRATWVTLLQQLQLMEQQSQDWEREHFTSNGPTSSPPADFRQRTLAVAVQAKKRSWDTMPANIKKPYATTTMCHLLEIAAMLGIYWQEFDRSTDKYRGEGNGYMLTGTHVPDLGVMFTFQICLKSRFQENRVIPVDEVKEMCCGFMSTIFQETKDTRRLDFPNEDAKDLNFLQLGSMGEIAETFVLIGCNTNTAAILRSNEKKHGHLFPVPFELLGMLGKTLHIRGSYFRVLPNPTPYHWDKKFFSMRKLVKEYHKRIADPEAMDPNDEQIQKLVNLSKKVDNELGRDVNSKLPGYSASLLDTLHDALDDCDGFLKGSTRDLVLMVLREHFQEILKMINNPDDEAYGDGSSTQAEYDDDAASQKKSKARRFDELSAASPEERQEKFMDIYFYIVLDQVRERAVQSFRRRTTTQYAPSTHEREPSLDSTYTGLQVFSAPATPAARPTSPRPPPSAVQESSKTVPQVHIQPPNTRVMDTGAIDAQATAIWATLVFRMLCWLILHDFQKKDVQIPKSELLGSRLPVYIA
ncbi:hypothetical protein QBC46DRAFT_174484 [Diplogelasinospora grovesii]|uniref:Modin n=1 Tax=Diplogelasinospora grovesii TaxID=303347 RepID=A0AAN6N5V4_9PEZI|nr:hypothetical protein QBC46DRAFT_174484 [Diplogelasinospora grovesii]